MRIISSELMKYYRDQIVHVIYPLYPFLEIHLEVAVVTKSREEVATDVAVMVYFVFLCKSNIAGWKIFTSIKFYSLIVSQRFHRLVFSQNFVNSSLFAFQV